MVEDTPSILNQLGPFPILQFWAGVAILGAGVFAMWRGAKRKPTADEELQHTLRFDGPIAVTIKLLEKTASSLDSIRGAVYGMAENGRAQTKVLEDIRTDLRNRNHRRD